MVMIETVPRLRYLSLFAGVGGFDLGADQAGWECVGQVEWDNHCQKVLARHWPTVPRWSDVRDFHGSQVIADVIVGGFPCQDVSVAGQRKGIGEDTRSGLYGEILRIVREMRDATDGASPRWVILENVRGLLSIDKGEGFRQILSDLQDCGSLLTEWVMLDTQQFGPPQRRQRIFVAACFDSGTVARCPDPLFPVSESLPGDTQQEREAGEGVAGTLGGGSGSRGWACDTDRMTFVPVAFHQTQTPVSGETAPTLGTTSRGMGVVSPELVVRRLMPVECERLQGWNDFHTALAADGTTIADSHRYRMIGNGISSPVARWVCEQIGRV